MDQTAVEWVKIAPLWVRLVNTVHPDLTRHMAMIAMLVVSTERVDMVIPCLLDPKLLVQVQPY